MRRGEGGERKGVAACSRVLSRQAKIHVVVNFLSQVIFVFLLFLGMVMYANEIETKEK